MEVWVAYVTHAHGTELYAAATRDSLEAQLASFCRLWWHELNFAGDSREDTPPSDDLACIRTYFDHIDGEYCSMQAIEI
jgi:hypothetical protein